MKKTFTTLTLFLAFLLQIINAQQTQPQIQLTLRSGQTYSQAIAGSMQPLNTGRIPYGVLYEKVVGWAGLTEWSSGDSTNFAHIKQAWWDLENAKTVPTNTLDNLKQQVTASLNGNKIPIAAINFGFGYVDSLALKDGRIRIENNQIIDTGGASPYLTKKVHLAALSVERVVAGTTYRLVAGAPFLLHNLTDEAVAGYTVQNLANGQMVSVPASGSANITFPLQGTNTLKITINTGKGSYTAYQKINVAPSGASTRGTSTRGTSTTGKEPEHRLLTSAIAFKGYDETAASVSHADYHIYYHFINNDTIVGERVLKKPIVILDGFDPQDSRNYAKIYNSLLVYDNKKLGHQLRLKGYDVVILNFPVTGSTEEEFQKNGKVQIPFVNGIRRDGGTDYIERNAYLLVKLIQDLNAELRRNGSKEKLVIVGPSMGGQISRYALAYMEKEQEAGKPDMDHNTRLWVSFDSPHLGANIPLAVQRDLSFFGYEGGKQAAKDAYNSKLYSPAARQMLIEQLNDRGGIIGPNSGLNGAAWFHTKYYAALRSNGLPNSDGWPGKLRKIALVNGSGNGADNGTPSSTFLTLRAHTKTWFRMKAAEIDNHFLANTNVSDRYFRGFIRSGLSMAETSESVKNLNHRGSMDVLPGGTFNAQGDVKREFETELDNPVKVWPFKIWLSQEWTIKYDHCFIPTISALGFKNANFKWNTKINNRDLVQTGEIPFDNYFLPSDNQEHVSLTKESVAWLVAQLDGNYYNQTGEMKISGPSAICDQSTYTVNNLPPGATVQWSMSEGNLAEIISGQGTNSVVLKRKGRGNMRINAKSVLGSNAHDLQSEEVSIGPPDVSLITVHIVPGIKVRDTYTQSYICENNPNILVVRYAQDDKNILNYEWKIIDAEGKWFIAPCNLLPNFRHLPWSCVFLETGGIRGRHPSIGVRALNACGWSEWKTILFKSKQCQRYPAFTLSPNPATSLVTLQLQDETPPADMLNNKISALGVNKPRVSGVCEIQLWNAASLLRTYKTDRLEYQISVSDLPAGIYFVRVIKNGETYTQKLIKN